MFITDIFKRLVPITTIKPFFSTFSSTKNRLTIKNNKVNVCSMKISHIIDLATSRLTKHLTLVFIGNIFAAFLGFLAVLIISIELTVHDYGLFNIAISAMLIASRFSGLGMDTAMIRFTSSYLGVEKTAEATQVLRATFLVRIIVSSILSIIIFNTADLLSTKVFHYSSLTPLLKLAAFGVLVIPTFNYLKSVLYTYQLFQTGVILQILVDFGKLSTVLVIIFCLNMNTLAAVAAFAITPLIGGLLGFGLLWQKFFSKRKPIQNLFSQLFSYSKWMFVSNVCEITLPYVGIFMLAKILSSEAAGLYGLALNLAYIFPMITYSLMSVLLPEVSRFREIAQLDKYIRGSLKISLYIGVAVVPFLFFSHKIILFFFGSRYLDSVTIFNWLMLGHIIFTINSTIRVTLHSMNRPQVLAMVDLLKLTVMVIGCYLLIPLLGSLAPAIMALVVNVSALSFFSIYVFKKIRERDISFQNEVIIEPYSD